MIMEEVIMVYTTSTDTVRDVEIDRRSRRFGPLALLLSALAGLVIGWFGGQAAETNNADNIPGGAPTDNAPGSSTSDR
jgi:hypothetical protein